MRYLLSVLLLPALLWLPPALAQENEAEKLFHAVEKKIQAAKAVRLAADIETGGKDKQGKLKGSLLLTKDGKVQLKLSGDIGGKDLTVEMVSDGKEMKGAMTPQKLAEAKAQPTPKKFHGLLSTMVSRAGLLGVFRAARGAGAAPKEIDPEEFCHVADFKAGPAEKVGGQDAKVISYSATIADKDAAKVTLWLDAKTLLPRKRLIVSDKEGIRITETYTEFKLNPEVDAKVFELPK